MFLGGKINEFQSGVGVDKDVTCSFTNFLWCTPNFSWKLLLFVGTQYYTFKTAQSFGNFIALEDYGMNSLFNSRSPTGTIQSLVSAAYPNQNVFGGFFLRDKDYFVLILKDGLYDAALNNMNLRRLRWNVSSDLVTGGFNLKDQGYLVVDDVLWKFDYTSKLLNKTVCSLK